MRRLWEAEAVNPRSFYLPRPRRRMREERKSSEECYSRMEGVVNPVVGRKMC
jgi:Mor family transcriptional regulator